MYKARNTRRFDGTARMSMRIPISKCVLRVCWHFDNTQAGATTARKQTTTADARVSVCVCSHGMCVVVESVGEHSDETSANERTIVCVFDTHTRHEQPLRADVLRRTITRDFQREKGTRNWCERARCPKMKYIIYAIDTVMYGVTLPDVVCLPCDLCDGCKLRAWRDVMEWKRASFLHVWTYFRLFGLCNLGRISHRRINFWLNRHTRTYTYECGHSANQIESDTMHDDAWISNTHSLVVVKLVIVHYLLGL